MRTVCNCPRHQAARAHGETWRQVRCREREGVLRDVQVVGSESDRNGVTFAVGPRWSRAENRRLICLENRDRDRLCVDEVGGTAVDGGDHERVIARSLELVRRPREDPGI